MNQGTSGSRGAVGLAHVIGQRPHPHGAGMINVRGVEEGAPGGLGRGHPAAMRMALAVIGDMRSPIRSGNGAFKPELSRSAGRTWN